jgi:hypothetical protein
MGASALGYAFLSATSEPKAVPNSHPKINLKNLSYFSPPGWCPLHYHLSHTIHHNSPANHHTKTRIFSKHPSKNTAKTKNPIPKKNAKA